MSFFKRGGTKATKASDLVDETAEEADEEAIKVKTHEQMRAHFDLLVEAWSRERTASSASCAVAVWDSEKRLARVVRRKGKSLAKFGYEATTVTAVSTPTGPPGGTRSPV